ncbi:MAG: RHS repeat-associated core domain-containing protein [Spirochaetaceae bacterium]|jgi:RHS repeat-associated protein|nr:RHS repeat-associated core domain-containing protein [Spirochaetaceae bacterium]
MICAEREPKTHNSNSLKTPNFPAGNDLGEEGLYYFNARWYDPQLGRFITEDPIKDGINYYAYANNNPLRFIDPTGLKPQDEVGDGLMYDDQKEEYSYNDCRDVKKEAHIDITRDAEDGYYIDTLQLKVGDNVIAESKVQSEADHPVKPEDGTISAGVYKGYVLDETYSYDDPILLVNDALKEPAGEGNLIHGPKVTGSGRITEKFEKIESLGPYISPGSAGCQITQTEEAKRNLTSEMKKMGFEPRGTYNSAGEIFGNPDIIEVRITDQYKGPINE